MKPISFDRLQKALDTYFDIYGNVTETSTLDHDVSEFMFVRSDRKMIKIDYDTIRYIESYSDYLKIHTANETIVTRETITAIEAKLPKHQFLRIHRSYIISIKYIQSFTNEYITIHKQALPISRSYKKDVLKQLEKF